MAEYKLTTDPDAVIETKTGNWVLSVNPEWEDYQTWLKAGNVPDAFVPDAASTAYNAKQKALSDDADRRDLLDRLQSATPAQIKTYVDNNVNNLAEAKALFKKILLILSK